MPWNKLNCKKRKHNKWYIISNKFWQSYLLSRHNFLNMITIRVQLMHFHFHCWKLNLLKASIVDAKGEHPLQGGWMQERRRSHRLALIFATRLAVWTRPAEFWGAARRRCTRAPCATRGCLLPPGVRDADAKASTPSIKQQRVCTLHHADAHAWGGCTG